MWVYITNLNNKPVAYIFCHVSFAAVFKREIIMKISNILACMLGCLSTSAFAESVPEIIDTTNSGVFHKFETTHQVQERMAQTGFNFHRCGVRSVKQSAPMQQQADTPHSQFQCVYSKPGATVGDESQFAYWHLNVSYNAESGLYRAGNEFTDFYTTNLYTIEPDYILDAGPHYYKMRAQLESMGMTIGDCKIQQIHYFMKPIENIYLSHSASCPTYNADGTISGRISLDIDYNRDNRAYSESQVNFISF